MTGHGGDVKSCDWHPTKAVLASGSKDGLVKVWDAKTGRNIATLHGHRNTVMQTLWNANGNWLLSACRDQSLKVRPATCFLPFHLFFFLLLWEKLTCWVQPAVTC